MNLSEVEEQIVDVLTLNAPEWRINPDIAIQIGRMHNYCAKILAQLIKKGLAESRYVEENGNQKAYKEYRLVSTQPNGIPSKPVNKPVDPFTSKIERINKGISPENVRNLIERCQKVLMGYPDGHPQRPRIEEQIAGLKVNG